MGTMHHCQVGCADCSVIISANHTFLIDCHGIDGHTHLLPSSKSLLAVFITHQHYDHFDGLNFLKDNGYSITHLIHSPYVRRYGDSSVEIAEWNDFTALKDYFVKKGTTVHAPYRQTDYSKAWWEIDGLKFFILGPDQTIATSDTRELHDASLVVWVGLGSRKCLFTGDASDTNLNHVSRNTINICDDILHASHHGSLNGADLDFVKACKAEYTVISTESGVHESVPHDTALQRYKAYTKKVVYRTDVTGGLKWTF